MKKYIMYIQISSFDSKDNSQIKNHSGFAPNHPQLSKWRPPRLRATAALVPGNCSSKCHPKNLGALRGLRARFATWKHETRGATTTNKSLTLLSMHHSDAKVRNMRRTKIHADLSSTKNCTSVNTARSSKTFDLSERAFLLHISPTEDLIRRKMETCHLIHISNQRMNYPEGVLIQKVIITISSIHLLLLRI